MVKLVSILEQHDPSPVVLHEANLHLGHREGLRVFKLAGAQE